MTVTCDASKLVNIPNALTRNDAIQTYKEPNIIGFFGVIGELPSKTYSYPVSSATEVHDLYLDKITIQNSTTTPNVLSGLLAGYVGCSINQCGVYRGKFDFANNTTNIANSFDNVSDYSLIGSYDTDKYTWVDIPGGGGQENDFGGSIDFASFDKRVSYVLGGKREDKSGQNNTSTNSKMNATVYRLGLSTFYYWDLIDNRPINNAGLSDGTYMPLNIDKSKITAESGKTIEYDVSNGEPVLNTNTGYITGYDSKSNSSPRISHSETPYKSVKRLNLSIAEYESSTLFDSSNYSFLYYDQSDKKTYRLIDSDNSQNTFESAGEIKGKKIVGSDITFKKYDSVKKDLLKTFEDGTSNSEIQQGVINLHGLMFYSKQGEGIDSFGTLVGKNIKLNKKTYESYLFYKNGINFTLTKPGYITMVCGAYRTSPQYSTSYDGFYSLYSLNRSDDGTTINSKEEIKTIYLSGDGTTIEYNPSSVTGKKLQFDFSSLNSGQHLMDTAMFYFEFPLNAGDYFLCEEQNRNSPYLLYLDIGANASDDADSEKAGVIQDIDFVFSTDGSHTGMVKTTDEGYTASQVLFKIANTSTGQQFYFMRSSTGVVFYAIEGTGLTLTVIGVQSNAASNDESKWTSA